MFDNWICEMTFKTIFTADLQTFYVLNEKPATNPFLCRKYEHLVNVRTKEMMSYNFMMETQKCPPDLLER